MQAPQHPGNQTYYRRRFSYGFTLSSHHARWVVQKALSQTHTSTAHYESIVRTM